MNDDRISEVYKGELWDSVSQERARRRIHWLCGQVVGKRVLDLGCSQGIASILLGREGFEVVGVDVQPSSIGYAQEDLAGESEAVRARVEFMVGEGADLPFEDGFFDSVLLGEVIEHVVAPGLILEEARRVLRPDGRVVITTPFGLLHHHDHKQTFFPRDVIELVGATFDVVSVDVVDRYFRIVGAVPSGEARPLVEVLYESADVVAATTRGIQEDLVNAKRIVDRQRGEVAELRREVAELRREVAELGKQFAEMSDLEAAGRREVERLTAALERTRRETATELEAAGKTISSLRSTVRQVGRLRARVGKLEEDRWKLRNDLAVARWKLESFRARKWWRIGGILGQLRRRPWRILVVPFDVISTIFSTSQLPNRPQLPPKPQAPNQPESSTAAAFRWPPPTDLAPVPRRLIAVATVLSEADDRKFEHEWEAFPLTADNWREVLARVRPSLLFASNDGWERIGPDGVLSALTDSGWSSAELLGAFKEGGVRMAFWDKRPSAPTNRPLEYAALFDQVFCASESLLGLYRDVGDHAAHLLTESVQTRVFNPTSVGRRKREVFALDREDRERDEDPLLLAAGDLGLEVFESNGRKISSPDGGAEFQLAGRHQLQPGDIPVAPKLFKVAIGPHLGEGSRVPARVLELVATNTPVVVNENPEIERIFGPAVLQASKQAEAGDALKCLLRSEELRSRFSHRALRAVLRSETTSHRVDQILSVGETLEPLPIPSLTMMIPTNRPHQLTNILANLGRQTYPHLRAVLVLHGIRLDQGQVRDEALRHGVEHLEVLEVDESVILGEVFNRGFGASDGEFVGKMDDDDFYGAEYAWDLMSAFTYTDADIVGKWAHYAYLESLDSLILRFGGAEYSYQPVVAISTLVMKREVAERVRFPAMPSGSGSQFLRAAGAEGARVYSGDRFNYLYQRYSSDDHHTWFFSDFDLMAKSDFVSRGKNIDHVVD